MSYNQVILLLGTNLGDKKSNLQIAELLISKRIGRIIKKSQILETEPIGFDSMNIFLNQTLSINTALSPVSLLKAVKLIEAEMGRIKTNPEIYEDRIIDIDILKFSNLTFKCKALKIPHHQINSRPFVKKLL